MEETDDTVGRVQFILDGPTAIRQAAAMAQLSRRSTFVVVSPKGQWEAFAGRNQVGPYLRTRHDLRRREVNP